MIEAEAPPASQDSQATRARGEFVSTLGRRLTALRNALHQLEDRPASRERRDMLLRRVHALGSAATVLGFDGVSEALTEAERALERSAQGGPVTSTDLAEVSRALDALPSIAWGAKPPRSVVEPRELSFVALGWPISILVFGPKALQSSLATAEEQLVEVELASDSDNFRELARQIGPDVAVVDGDLRGARELIEALGHDPELPPFPVIVVGSFDQPEAASGYVALGAARVLPKPVGPDALWHAVLEVCQHETGLRGPREPIGDVTVDELAHRIALEVRRGLVEGVDPSSAQVSVPLGEGTDVLAAVWGAVARVRELLTMRSRGSVRFTSGGPEGAVPLAPWTAVDRRAGDRTPDVRRTDGVPLEGRRAVVVDDDPAVVWFLSGLLRTSGVEVAEAHDGLAARRLVFDGLPDLVVSDVLMPGLDGFSLCHDIKRDVAVRDVPVILLSWKEDLLQRVRELGANADGYLRKEAAASTVLSRVREVLRPRARVESRLRAGGEVRGRLDGMTTRLLLDLTRKSQPNARVAVRDSVYLYELDLREGRPLAVTRTATDGSFERGPRIFDALIGISAGRFVVTPSTAHCRDDLKLGFDELVRPRIQRARALQRLLEARELERVDKVEIDSELVGAYLEATPEPARGLFARLLGGMGPRELLAAAPEKRLFLEQVLADISRRGAVISLERDGEAVDLDKALGEAPKPAAEGTPAPLFTLDLSSPPPDVADRVARWEEAPLPLSRTVTPLPVVLDAHLPSAPFKPEPGTAPGMGPPVPVEPFPPAPSAGAERVEPKQEASRASDEPEERPSDPESVHERVSSSDLIESKQESSEPETLQSDTGEPNMQIAESPTSERAPDSDDESPAPSSEPRATDSNPPESGARDTRLSATPETLRAETADLPEAKPISFPNRKAEGARASSPAAASVKPPQAAKESRPPEPVAKPVDEDKPIGLGKVVLLAGVAAAVAFGGVTLVRGYLTPAAPVADTASPETSAPVALVKPAPKAQAKLAVEDMALGAGAAVSGDQGQIEIQVKEKYPVHIDGSFVGRGPNRKIPISPGSHQVVIKAPDGDLSIEVVVKTGRTSLVTLPAP
ncbi:MAG: response regulator [Polyangiaceae bacterium]